MNNEYKNMLDMLEPLDSQCFTYNNYEPCWWTLLDLGFEGSLDIKNILKAVKEYAVGYCESARITLRPKSSAYAVMFEKDGERFWFHLEKWYFNDEEI